jgi:hypothetical protein
MLPEYQFFLKTDNQAQWQPTHAIWKDDLALEWKLESGQMFFRSELSGSIDFIRDDYEYIMSKQFGIWFHVMINIRDGIGGWQTYWYGRFTITDCKIDVDNKKITVKPEVEDQYIDILAGMDNEYDLIKLAPAITRLQVHKRPAFQIFDTASEKVTTVLGNISFEQEASLPSESVAQFLRKECHFFAMRESTEIQITNPPFGQEAQFRDPFTGTITQSGDRLTNGGNYFIEYEEERTLAGFIQRLKIIAYAQPDIVDWLFDRLVPVSLYGLPASIEFEAQHTIDPNLNGDCIDHGFYGRIITNCKQVNGNDMLPLYEDDICGYNRNYRFAYPYDVSYMLDTYSRQSSQPTKWGKSSNGYYYLPPNDTDEWIPIGQNLWGEVTSQWIQKNYEYEQIEELAQYDFILNNAYSLEACIGVLLQQIAPSVTFQASTLYSHFLYSGNDSIGGHDNRLYLTPKTNITNGEYETPAQKASVTLKDILNMLRDTYQCYWFIGDVNGSPALRIEHIKYFMNGGSYSTTPAVGVDLTTLKNKRNGKYWDFCTNVYEFEKLDMPQRYQFDWMDDVTEMFKGLPIVIDSPYVQQDKNEDIHVANFTTDIDYMLLNPQAISPDGFCLLNAVYDSDEGEYVVPVVNIMRGSVRYRSQNGYLSFYMLQNPYWLYNMPASRLIFNESETTYAVMVSRMKKQTVNIPLGMPDQYRSGDIDLQKLIKTGLGYGQIHSVSVRLTTRMAKTELRYDTEQ